MFSAAADQGTESQQRLERSQQQVRNPSKPPARSTTDDSNGEIQYAHDSSNGIQLDASKARNKYACCLVFWRDSFTNPPRVVSVLLSHSQFPALHAKELLVCFLGGDLWQVRTIRE